MAAEAVHRLRGQPRGGAPVHARRDGRAAGAPPHVDAARALLPRARGVPGPPGAGERVLHAGALTGTSRASRHARRLRPAGRRVTSDGSCTSPSSSCRSSTSVTRRSWASPARSVMDVDLRGGDTLYLPRGWLHEALTSERRLAAPDRRRSAWSRGSTHCAQRSRRCEDDVEFRRSVPRTASARTGSSSAGGAPRGRATWRAACARGSSPAARPVLDGQLGRARGRRASLTAESPVERRETVHRRPERSGDVAGARLRGGERVCSRPRAASSRRSSPAGRRVRPSELPGELDDDGRLVLARRLVREGFLRRRGLVGTGAPVARTTYGGRCGLP